MGVHDIFWAVILTWAVTGVLATLFMEKPSGWWQAGAKLFVAGPFCWVAFAASIGFFAARGDFRKTQDAADDEQDWL